MSKGNLVRLPSENEKTRAESNNSKPYFPKVGRYFTSKTGKIMITLNSIPDAVFMLSEDKPREQTGGEAI